MSEHRAIHARTWMRHVTSVRARALLSLGIALGLGAVGTFAYWTDEVTINAGAFTSGTLDIQVNGQNAYSSSSLSMSAMVPGSTSAEVLVIKNVGTAPAKYTVTGGLSGTNASDFSAAATAGLLVTIRAGGTVSGSTCIGGSVVFTEAPLTNVTTTSLVARRPATALGAANGLGVGGGTESLCVQLKLSDAAATGLQGKTATVVFAAVGTSDVS